MKVSNLQYIAIGLLIFCFSSISVEASRIGDFVDINWSEQVFRFLSFKDTSVRYAFWGAVLMGTCCGLLGSFTVVRKMSLAGDTLSHAVLPGVVLGFLWAGEKSSLAIFIGATLVGLLALNLVDWVKNTTHLKHDSILGMILSGFYGIGICLLTMIQRADIGNKSGVDKFLFGQAAALSYDDLVLMSVITFIVVLFVYLLYKEILVLSFDKGFSSVLGLPIKFLTMCMTTLLVFTVVISLQAVGIVLVSAMLIIPAAIAYLLVDKMAKFLVVAVFSGIGTGVIGIFLSFLGNNFPTGPFIVVSASLIFVLVFLFSPRYGFVLSFIRNNKRDNKIRAENTLRAVYLLLESKKFNEEIFSLRELAQKRNTSTVVVEEQMKQLIKGRFAYLLDDNKSAMKEAQTYQLTQAGWIRACEITRNHRLWELYLTNAVNYPADHVHDDAERIEHILGEDIVRKIERMLDYPQVDPHGKKIPSIEDMHKYGVVGDR